MNGAPNEVAAAVSETAMVTVAPLVDPRLAGAPFQATTTAAPGGAETYVGAPMSPEHSDGLDDAELPARTVATGETRFERLRRIVLHSGTLLAQHEAQRRPMMGQPRLLRQPRHQRPRLLGRRRRRLRPASRGGRPSSARPSRRANDAASTTTTTPTEVRANPRL